MQAAVVIIEGIFCLGSGNAQIIKPGLRGVRIIPVGPCAIIKTLKDQRGDRGKIHMFFKSIAGTVDPADRPFEKSHVVIADPVECLPALS